MNYANYDRAVVTRHHVQLLGWPMGVPFANPSNIGQVDQIRTLCQALESGACRFHVLTKRQQAAHAAKIQEMADAGEVVGWKRKVRADKGKKRLCTSAASENNVNDGNGEEEAL